MKFPYQPYQIGPSPTAPSGILYRPEIPLRIIGATTACTLWPLVDTGSDDTLLPLSVGRAVGAALDAKQNWQAEGIGGQTVAIILGEVTLELSGSNQVFRWVAKVGSSTFPRRRTKSR